MAKSILFFIAMISLGCNGKSLKKSAVKKKTDTNIALLNATASAPVVDRTHSLIGIWTNGLTGNATMEIHKDSIFYVERFERYKYLLTNDSIKIYYPDYIYSAKCFFMKDTLVMSSKEDGMAKFWHFKE